MYDDDPAVALLTEAETCGLLKLDADTLHALVANDAVLEIRTVRGSVYPAFQVSADATPLPGLAEVIGELCVVNDPWLWWYWLLRPTPAPEPGDPDDVRPRARWEQLRDGDLDEVIRAASRSAWVWRDTP